MMKNIYLVVLAVFIVATFLSCEIRKPNTSPSISARGEEGLVAHYNFDEGSGSLAKDISGNGNDGKINGAEFVPQKDGYALKFDGVDDSVDCGKGPSLDITNAITVAAWVYFAEIPTVPSAWIIAGKRQDVYALCYYMTGWCGWYMSGGDNACLSLVSIEQWHHLAGTFDGKTTALYVDGELKLSKASKYSAITSRKDIALIIGSPHFSGMIDEVKIYRRALAAEEIGKHFQTEQAAKLARMSRVRDGKRLAGDGFFLKAGQQGGIQLDVGQDSYFIESSFSEPGETIQWNWLAEEPQAEQAWKPEVSRPSANEIVIRSKGTHYTLERKLRLDGGKIRVTDTLASTSSSPVGIIVQNHIIASRPFQSCLLGGMAVNSVSVSGGAIKSESNPTVFIGQDRSRLGVVAEDNISRLQFEASAALNRATVSIRHFGLAPGKIRVLEWTVYPLGADADYFTMINRIREDRKSNFMVDGEFEFGSIYRERWAKDPVLKAQLQIKPVKIFALGPFLDYMSSKEMTRSEYKVKAIETIAALKQVRPDIKLLGEVETGLVGFDTKKMPGGERLDEFIRNYKGTTYPFLPPEMTALIDAANLPWKDSYVRSTNGMIQMLIYKGPGRETNAVTALVVYPEIGNYQHQYLMEQVKFLIDEVGMEGIYFDGFGVGGPSYGKWDGVTVDINRNGNIVQQYMNTLLSGLDVRNDIAQYILSKGKILVGNGGIGALREEQSVPTFRFVENAPQSFKAGEKPPLNQRLCSLQLGSPIALMGAWGSAENIYKAVIAYLRHGLVCYFYNSNFSETGKGSGDYGPFRHMFPLTPVGLHEGWIEGKERIITCVSGSYFWKGNEKPIVYLFDAVGREKPHSFVIQKTKKTWKVKVDLKDWEEIAVIESPPGG